MMTLAVVSVNGSRKPADSLSGKCKFLRSSDAEDQSMDARQTRPPEVFEGSMNVMKPVKLMKSIADHMLMSSPLHRKSTSCSGGDKVECPGRIRMR